MNNQRCFGFKQFAFFFFRQCLPGFAFFFFTGFVDSSSFFTDFTFSFEFRNFAFCLFYFELRVDGFEVILEFLFEFLELMTLYL